MHFFYDLGIFFLGRLMWLAGLFHPKAKKWVEGRKNWQGQLARFRKTEDSWIWMHCASLGEFEQGRNVIEELKTHSPQTKILITFYSPSGYEIRKNYALADGMMYLPLDTRANAKTFLDLLKPKLVILVKYELWLNYIFEVKQRQIPLILISARVGKESPFFNRWTASLYKKAFQSFSHIFTQDKQSAKLIKDFSGNDRVSVVSDTRYDRVSSNREDFTPIPEIEAFKKNRLCLIGGSTWPKGEKMIFHAFQELQKDHDFVLILAPHEINDHRIAEWEKQFPEISIRFSQIARLNSRHRILWIDNIGMLSRLYHYGDLAYIGGGWGSGLHNILEAVVFGLPVIFGPQIQKFPEAGDLIVAGGGFAVSNQDEFTRKVKTLIEDKQLRESISVKNIVFIENKAGATQKIMDWLTTAGKKI